MDPGYDGFCPPPFGFSFSAYLGSRAEVGDMDMGLFRAGGLVVAGPLVLRMVLVVSATRLFSLKKERN